MKLHTNESDFRARRIGFAYLTSLVSKVVTACAQLLLIPMASVILGANIFGAVLVTGAISSFLTLPLQGLSNSLSEAVAQSTASGGDDNVRSHFQSAALIGWASAILVLVLIAVAVSVGITPYIYGRQNMRVGTELLLAMGAQCVMVYGFSWVEGIRSGLHENYVSNIFSTIGALTALCCIWLARATHAGPAFFYAALFVAPAFGQLLNFVHLMSSRSLIGRAINCRSNISLHLRRCRFGTTAQLGIVIYVQGTVFLAGKLLSLSAGGVVGGFLRIFITTFSLVNALLLPVYPTLSAARAIDDQIWLKKSLRLVGWTVVFAAASVFLGMSLLGQIIGRTWIHSPFEITASLKVALGIFGTSYIISLTAYLTLVSLDDVKWPAARLLIGGPLAIAAGTFGYFGDGLIGLVGLSGIAFFICAALPLARRLSLAAT